MVINTNTASSNIAGKMKSTQALLNKALARLSSGSKINQPQDDAAGLSMSLRLRNNLTQNAAGESNLTSMASLIHTQNGVLKTIDKTLRRMGELSMLYKDKTKSAADIALYNEEFEQLNDVIDELAVKRFNGKRLFNEASPDQVIGAEGKITALNQLQVKIVYEQIHAWGMSQPADNRTTVPAGMDDVTAVAAGWNHNLALDSAGGVTAWGSNADGQLDVPSTLTAAQKVVAGDSYSAALSDGKVVVWGNNTYGQQSIPAGLSTVVDLSAGDRHLVVAKKDGTVAAWGDNSKGQSTVPGGLTNVVAVAAGQWHTLALKSDGTVVAWGSNVNNDGSITLNQSVVPAGLTGVVAIAAGGYHSTALKSDGTIVQWGLPGATTTPPSSETNPATATTTTIANGDTHSIGIKADGTVIAWGNNADNRINIPAGVTKATAIATAEDHSLAVQRVKLDINDLAGIVAATEAVATVHAQSGANLTRVEAELDMSRIISETTSSAVSRITDVDVAQEMTRYTRFQILANSAASLLAKANSLPASALRLLS